MQSVTTSAASPFAGHRGPSPRACLQAVRALQTLHGKVRRKAPLHGRDPALERCGHSETVLDALVRTILSQNTTDANSARAMRALRASFPSYQDVLTADSGALAAAIACGGLGNVKARRIKNLLASVLEARGTLSLEHLRGVDDASAMAALMAFEGVGPKTAACVLLFCLGRDRFAVDTHVFRIARGLGWVPPQATRITCQAHLEVRVPPELKYALHVLLVRHGKRCPWCRARGEGVAQCPYLAPAAFGVT